METIAPDSVSTLAVISLDHIGDIVLATPVFSALRRRFPKARITAVVGPWSQEVLRNNPNIDEIVPYRAEWHDRSRAAFDPEIHARNRETLARLASHPFDLVVNLRNDHFNLSLGNALTGRYFLSYANNPSHRLLVSHPVERHAHPVHAMERHIKLLGAIGATVEPVQEIYPSAQDEAWAEEQLKGKGPWIALAPGTGWAAKRWPEERFIELGVALAGRGFPIVVVGGPSEARVGEELQRRAGALNLCSQTTVLSLAALLRRVAVVVNNDSAPAHIGAAMGAAVVDIIQPHIAIEFSPVTSRRYLLMASACAAPCTGWDFGFDPNMAVPPCACIHAVTVEQALRAVYQAIIDSQELGLLKWEGPAFLPAGAI